MDYKSCLQQIDELYDSICEIENETKRIFASKNMFHESELKQEDFDFSAIYDRLVRILLPLLDWYPYVFRTSKKNKALKVYYVALCEMIKQDYNRGMLITFRNVTGENELNTNRYYDLIQQVSNSQGLKIKRKNGRRQFEEAYILETGIPRNLTKYVMKMFRIYWRYFREYRQSERLHIIHDFIYGNELMDEYIIDRSDARLFDAYSSYLRSFPEKAIKVFDKLDLIFSEFDQYAGIINQENQEDIVEEVSRKVGFDISTVLRDSELTRFYSIYLKQVPINKFLKILNNLPKSESIGTPDGDCVSASRLFGTNIQCGIYKIRGNTYHVVVDPNINLDDMLCMQCDKVIQLSPDYYCYFSRQDFDVEYNGISVATRALSYKSQYRRMWFGRLQPASTVVVDGKTIVSSEQYKHSYRIHKRFDYDKKISNLYLSINSVKANNPEKPFGRLYYSINGSDKKLVCVGNNKGLYYAENISEIISNCTECDVKYWIDDEIILEDTIVVSDRYVFDKWNGTEYTSGRNNEKHSGSIIIFDRNILNEDDLPGKVTKKYLDGLYNVYEIENLTCVDELIIGEDSYQFSNAGRPAVFISNELGDTELVDDIRAIVIKVINTDSNAAYRLSAENKDSNWNILATNGEYHIEDIIPRQDVINTGKWTVSLWEGQVKIDSTEFNLIPKLEVLSNEKAVLEGKDICISIKASEDCFITEVGEYASTTTVNLGGAFLENTNNGYSCGEIEYYVYLDSLGISKKIVYNPVLWGIRTKDIQNTEFSRNKSVLLDISKMQETAIAIVSNGIVDLWVNGKAYHYSGGIHEIDYGSLLGSINRKNELIFTDDVNTEKVVLACNPTCKLSELSISDDIVVTLKYTGPVDQNVKIRTFIDSFKGEVYEKVAGKNQMFFHIPFGSAKKIEGKRIVVDVCTSKNGLPIQVVNTIITLPEKQKDTAPSVLEKNLKLSEFLQVDKLLNYYQNRESKTVDIAVNMDSITRVIKELY